jgi:hypothetical protein
MKSNCWRKAQLTVYFNSAIAFRLAIGDLGSPTEAIITARHDMIPLIKCAAQPMCRPVAIDVARRMVRGPTPGFSRFQFASSN